MSGCQVLADERYERDEPYGGEKAEGTISLHELSSQKRL
jgi:hypothetical protein